VLPVAAVYCDAADVDEAAGYREVHRPGSAYPLMTISTRAGMAVVHLFREDSCFLLNGDGIVDPSESWDFRILDIDAAFTGEFICDAKRAEDVVEAFLLGIDADELGTWTIR